MRKKLGILAVAVAALLASAGCTLLPTSHASFDAWLTGDPDRDYDTLSREAGNGHPPGTGLVIAVCGARAL